MCQAIKANGEKCANGGYYQLDDKIYCGVHCKSANRVVLDKNKIIKNNNRINTEESLMQVAIDNATRQQRGKVIVSKLLMMRAAPEVVGYLNVFPNFKHQNRKDGFGCASLSPMSLGPVPHNMPNLPAAQNIENYHQFAKVFSSELDDNNQLKSDYLENRIKAYNDTTPHRHKPEAEGKNKNVPVFSLYYDADGNEKKYNYIQSRYFYCHWYEKLADQTKDFARLKEKLTLGYNLNIIGYDGYNTSPNKLWENYNDVSRPFGHELVLYTLLVIEDAADYP